MGLGNESKPVNQPLDHDLGFLDPLGNLDFLFPGQERDLAHLLEIHPDRVIQNIKLRLGLLFLVVFALFFAVLVAIDLRRFDNVDLHPTEPGQDCVELIRVADVGRERLVEIVESEVALLFRQLYQLANPRLNVRASGRRQHLFGVRIIRPVRVFRLGRGTLWRLFRRSGLEASRRSRFFHRLGSFLGLGW